MSGTCIVCLGDLGDSSGQVPARSSVSAKSPTESGLDKQAPVEAQPHAPGSGSSAAEDAQALIAQLRPCGHNLHNDCLTPWVERANSCPICRQSFYIVDLSDRVGGKSLDFLILPFPADLCLLGRRRCHFLLPCPRQSSGSRSRPLHVPRIARRGP